MKNKVTFMFFLLLTFFFAVHAEEVHETEETYVIEPPYVLEIPCVHKIACTDLPTGFYVGASGGVNFQTNAHWHGKSHNFKTTWNPGYVVGGTLGYRFSSFQGRILRDCQLRLEGEFAHRKNTLHTLTIQKQEVSDVKFYNGTNSYMMNVYLDFPIFSCPGLFFYAGSGVGYVTGKAVIKLENLEVSTKDTGLMAPLICGMGYSSCGNAELGIEYCWFPIHSHFDDHSLILNLKFFFR